MKIIYPPLICFLISVAIISCSSDDSSGGGDEISAELVGTWELTEVNVSEPIDTNNNGTTITNLMIEVDCLRDILTLSANDQWSSVGVFPSVISPITGNLYNVSCSDEIERSGQWGFSVTSLTLIGDFQGVFSYNGGTLTLGVGDDLPGIQSLVYIKQ